MQDSSGTLRPVVQFIVNDIILAIVSSTNFTLPTTQIIPGFSNITVGINLSSLAVVNGNITGKSQRADRLDVARNINGVSFNGTSDITIRSSTTRSLNKGSYIIGNNFDGSNETTWSVNATPNNTVGTVVARDSAGDFSAGTISANLVGNVTGNVTASLGTSTFSTVVADRFIGATLSGNSFSTTRLQTSRLINGVPFDGTEDITVSAAASTLSGNSLSNSVIFSNLSQVGTLTNLNVTEQGINVGTQLKLSIVQGIPTIEHSLLNQQIRLQIKDTSVPGTNIGISLIPAETSQSGGGENTTTLIPTLNDRLNIGHPQFKINKIYATDFIGNFLGNSTTSTESTLSVNLKGGFVGAIPYQIGSGTTAFLPPGQSGQVLITSGSAAPVWKSILTRPTASTNIIITNSLSGDINDYTIAVESTSDNISEKIVSRNENGDFSARFINASLVGTPTAPTPLPGDDSDRIATTTFVKNAFPDPEWAGVSTFNNVVSTYASFPVGTKVAYWEERRYFRPANSNGGQVMIDDLYRRVIRKNSPTSWGDVGG
jgi:hypothetical protein